MFLLFKIVSTRRLTVECVVPTVLDKTSLEACMVSPSLSLPSFFFPFLLSWLCLHPPFFWRLGDLDVLCSCHGTCGYLVLPLMLQIPVCNFRFSDFQLEKETWGGWRNCCSVAKRSYCPCGGPDNLFIQGEIQNLLHILRGERGDREVVGCSALASSHPHITDLPGHPVLRK